MARIPQKLYSGKKSRAGFDVQPAQTGQWSGSHFLYTNTRGMGVIITGRWRLGVTHLSRRRPSFDPVDCRVVSLRC